MPPAAGLPLESGRPPLKRHHTARYYAHRVKESLTTRVSKVVCSIFLTLLLILGIVAFVLWLSLRPHRPRFHVQSFSFPALAREDGRGDADITFLVTDRNPNQNVGIYYDAIQGTVYYQEKVLGATPLLFPFYQPEKNTTVLHGELSGDALAVTEPVWAQLMADRAAGTVAFRLEVAASIHFKISTWASRRHRMHASCDVGVGPDGQMLPAFKDRRCSLYFD